MSKVNRPFHIGRSRDNATMIARKLNEHADLLTALREAESALALHQGRGPKTNAALASARAAISKVTP